MALLADTALPFFFFCFAADRLTSNYAPYPDGNVPRQGLYFSYRRVCDQYGIPHINTATLGKAIRLCFPTIKTRRLGVRGNSKYHCEFHFPHRLESFFHAATTATLVLSPFFFPLLLVGRRLFFYDRPARSVMLIATVSFFVSVS